MANTIETYKSNITKASDQSKTIKSAVKSRLTSAASGAVAAAVSAVSGAVASAINTITSAVGSARNVIVNAKEKLIGAENSIMTGLEQMASNELENYKSKLQNTMTIIRGLLSKTNIDVSAETPPTETSAQSVNPFAGQIKDKGIIVKSRQMPPGNRS